MLIYYDIRACGEFDIVDPVINIEPDAGLDPDKIDPDFHPYIRMTAERHHTFGS